MNRSIAFALAAALAAGPALAGDPVDLEAHAAKARGAIQAFAPKLKGALKSAMQEGGPVNAIGVCHTEAPEIAADVSAAQGVDIARTSLKVRNPDNTPDAWEKAVLEAFEARKAAGEDPMKLEHYEVVEQDGEKVFRYMKAIPTGAVCLRCHGSEQVKPPVAERLSELYPEDQARGFNIGDLRGAFTIREQL